MNYIAQALSRIIWQYKNSPKFIEWMSILPTIAQQDLEQPAQQVIDILDIDNAEGELLDVIGRVVGRDRDDPLLLDDEVYRVVIKSKMFKNNSEATIDEIIEAAEYITGATVSALADNGDMSFTIQFSSSISDLVAQILVSFDLIPRPQGVKLAGFVIPPDGILFGFSEPGMATPSWIAGFSEIFGEGLYAVEVDDDYVLGLDDGSQLGIGELDAPATVGGGRFVELMEVL